MQIAGGAFLLLVLVIGGANGIGALQRAVLRHSVRVISYSSIPDPPARHRSKGPQYRSIVALVKNDNSTLVAEDVTIRLFGARGELTDVSNFGLRYLFPGGTVAVAARVLLTAPTVVRVESHLNHWLQSAPGSANYPTVTWSPVSAASYAVTLTNESFVATSTMRIVAVRFGRNTVPVSLGAQLVPPIVPRGRITVRVTLTGGLSQPGSAAVYEEAVE